MATQNTLLVQLVDLFGVTNSSTMLGEKGG